MVPKPMPSSQDAPGHKTLTKGAWTDDDDDEDEGDEATDLEYASQTYQPETYDELDYADEDDPASLSILERLALLEKAHTPPKKTKEAAGPSKVSTPDVGQSSKPKKTKKWTRAKEAEMCSLWEDEVHLYDCRHKDYKNGRRKEQAYNRMSAVLDIDGIYMFLK